MGLHIRPSPIYTTLRIYCSALLRIMVLAAVDPRADKKPGVVRFPALVIVVSRSVLGAHQARWCAILVQSIIPVERQVWSFYRGIFEFEVLLSRGA